MQQLLLWTQSDSGEEKRPVGRPVGRKRAGQSGCIAVRSGARPALGLNSPLCG
jgi:hypothetical protein